MGREKQTQNQTTKTPKTKTTKPKKTKLQKKKDNPNSSYWDKKALEAWRQLCNVKYNNQCAICGSTDNLQAHHIISKKACKALKYHPDNQILLCCKHHNWYGTTDYPYSAHKHSLAFYHHLSIYCSSLYKTILGLNLESEKAKTTSNREHYYYLLDFLEKLEK